MELFSKIASLQSDEKFLLQIDRTSSVMSVTLAHPALPHDLRDENAMGTYHFKELLHP